MLTRRAFTMGTLAGATARARGEELPGDDWWSRPGVRACCSLADAVYADWWKLIDGQLRVRVTGGGPRDHAWAPIGRVYVISSDQLKNEPGNPTGHGLLFLNRNNLDTAYCFLPGAGI